MKLLNLSYPWVHSEDSSFEGSLWRSTLWKKNNHQKLEGIILIIKRRTKRSNKFILVVKLWVYSLIILIHRAEVDGTKSFQIQYNHKRSMFFFLEETGGVKPLLIIYVNKKYKGVYKEKAYININCPVVQDSTQQ